MHANSATQSPLNYCDAEEQPLYVISLTRSNHRLFYFAAIRLHAAMERVKVCLIVSNKTRHYRLVTTDTFFP